MMGRAGPRGGPSWLVLVECFLDEWIVEKSEHALEIGFVFEPQSVAVGTFDVFDEIPGQTHKAYEFGKLVLGYSFLVH
jgi:hypothetical protein